ncbi:hypothetical protein QFC21_000046 [Naganishia friedmannii]|uniref:Uncharacterized protein n=1 Tax=Naganishia friedmannii TaxID=89922 RepID=A0ACC2WBD8_9TREE|nr:hypothetical protein QFC21_000046 [Naganishia friedmannii]
MTTALPDTTSFFVQAEYPFTSPDGSALSFARGEVIEVLTQLESGWWDGLLATGERGWFPSNYVRRIEDEEAERWFLAKEGESGVRDEEEGERMLLHAEADPEASKLFYHPVASPDMNNDPLQTITPVPNTFSVGHAVADPGSPETDADFWIPSLTADGQIYYRNTKTGQNAWDMPTIEGDDSSDGDNDHEEQPDDEQLTLSASNPHAQHDPTEELVDVVPDHAGRNLPPAGYAATLRIPPRGSSTVPAGTTQSGPSFGSSDAGASRRMDSDHNLAGILASSSTAAGPSTSIPALGPPWELRMRNNNAGWYYFNTVTGDVKTDRALQQQQQRQKEREGEVAHPSATGYAYQPAMGNVNRGTSGNMTRAISEPFNLAAAAAVTSSFSYPTNYPASHRSSSRSATPTPSTASRRPSTAGSTSATGAGGGSGSGAGRSRVMADFAEDALRVFGIGLGKKGARRKSSRASVGAAAAEKPQSQSQSQSQAQQQHYQQHRVLQTSHVNSSIGELSSENGRLRRSSSREDVGSGKRASAGSIPARSSSRMSLSYYQQQRQTLVPHGRADAAQGRVKLGGGAQDVMVDVADQAPGLFWSGNNDTGTAGQIPSQGRSAVGRRIMRDQTTLDDHVSRLQAQLALASEAAERHLLALQTPEQSLASLSLPDTPPAWPMAGSSTSPTVRISQTPEAGALRKQIDSLVPLVRELVYTTRHAVLGLHTTILDTLPATTANSEWTAEHALSFLSSEELHHSQRRLVAALSKIIFFAHSAAGTDWPLGGTAERLALDTRDLGYAVAAYLSEVQVVGCMNEQMGQGLKRPVARFGNGEEGEDEQMAAVGPFWQPFDAATGDRDWKELDSESERMLYQLAQGVEQSLLSLPLPSSYEAAQGIGTRLDETFRFLSDLDILATVDIDEDSLRDIPLDNEFDEYLKTVADANVEFSSYTECATRLQQTAGNLLLNLLDAEPVGLADTLSALPSILHSLTKSVSKLFVISKEQAQLVPIKLSPRIGAQSYSQAEQRHMATMQNDTASRRSSVASSASMFTRPITRHHNPQDSSQFLPNSHSMSSIPGQSISRTGSLTAGSRISASSSVSSLQTDEQFGYNFSRNSVGVYGRPSSNRKRSTSLNKKKLAKMLGEDEVGMILSPQGNRITLEEKPFYLNVDYADDDIIINADGSVKAGTLPALVERLTLHESMDPTFNSTFLMTYRSFATADEVLALLIQRYQLQPLPDLTPGQLSDWAERKQKPVKLRVFNILKTWLDQHYNETLDADILESIQEFATDIMARDTQVRMPSQQLIRAVQRRQSDGDILLRRMTTTSAAAPPPIVPKLGAGKALQLADINPIELARQMTLMEFELYNRIQPVDCLNKAWSQTDRPEAGPNIKAMILTSNRIAGWIAEAILVHNDPKKRASVMKHLVQAAEHCRAIHNFSTMAAIMAGLNSTPVRRLQRTRSLLSPKTLALFDDLDKTLDSGKNFAAYRERLKRVDPPCIPFLGVYLTFLTFIEDGNANFLPAPSSVVAATPSTTASTSSLRQQAQQPPASNPLASSDNNGDTTPRTATGGGGTTGETKRLLIHFSKRQKAADVIREIQQYQTIPYALTAQPVVQGYIRERLQTVENSPDLYEISLQLEPREREEEKM